MTVRLRVRVACTNTQRFSTQTESLASKIRFILNEMGTFGVYFHGSVWGKYAITRHSQLAVGDYEPIMSPVEVATKPACVVLMRVLGKR